MFEIIVNEFLKKGSCKFLLFNGDFLDFIFILKCKDFIDEDELLIYEFFYLILFDGEKKSLGSGLEKFCEFVLFFSGF